MNGTLGAMSKCDLCGIDEHEAFMSPVRHTFTGRRRVWAPILFGLGSVAAFYLFTLAAVQGWI